MQTMLDLARAIDPDGRMASTIETLRSRPRALAVVPFSEIQIGETFVFIAGKEIVWEKVGESKAYRVGTYRSRRVDPSYRVYRIAGELPALPRIPWVDA